MTEAAEEKIREAEEAQTAAKPVKELLESYESAKSEKIPFSSKKKETEIIALRMKKSELEKQNNVLVKDNGDLYDELKKKEKSATVNEGAAKLLEKLLEYAPEELAAAKQAVTEANAKVGKYRATHAPYGYVKGPRDKALPVRDEPAATIVRRIFEMRASCKTYKEIYTVLNDEKVPIPAVYLHEKFGIPYRRPNKNLWADSILRSILKNPTYLGHLVRLRYTTISYKNKRRADREPIVFPNAFEPLVTQELWDKCRELDESAIGHGKHTARGTMHVLSGLMFCADCGGKMKLGQQDLKPSKRHPEKRIRYRYICGNHSRFGKYYCFNHYIRREVIEELVLSDIRAKADLVMRNEKQAREDFLRRKEQAGIAEVNAIKKTLKTKQRRYSELEKLILSVYEDKVSQKIPEELCVKLLSNYTEEQNALKTDIEELEDKLSASAKYGGTKFAPVKIVVASLGNDARIYGWRLLLSDKHVN